MTSTQPTQAYKMTAGLLTVFAAFLLLTLVPYTIYSSVQLAYFLHGMHQARPDLWARDWYVTATQDPHPFFSSLVEMLYRWEILPEGLYGIRLFQFALLAIAIFRLCRLGGQALRIFPVVILLLVAYFSDGLGESSLFGAIVQPTDLAVPFYVLSLCFLLEGRTLLSFAWLGLSGLCHVHFATNGLIVLVIYYALRRKDCAFASLLKGGLLFLLLASPNLVPIFKNFSLSSPLLSPDIFRVFFDFRSPHHYQPSTFELSHAVRALFPSLFLLLGAPGMERDKPLHNMRALTAIILFLCALAVACAEWFYFPLVLRFFFFRLSPFVLLMGLVCLAAAMISALDRRNPRADFLVGLTWVILLLERDARLFIPLALLLIPAWLAVPWGPASETRPSLRISILVASVGLTAAGFILRGRLTDLMIQSLLAASLVAFISWGARSSRRTLLSGILILTVPSLAFHLTRPQQLAFHSFAIEPIPRLIREKPALAEVMSWMRSRTPKDSLFITPPYQRGIRFFSERAIVADDHTHGFRSSELSEWKERLEILTGSEHLESWKKAHSAGTRDASLRGGYLSLAPDRVEAIGRRYDAQYFLTESGYAHCKTLASRGHKIVFDNDSYLVYQLNLGP